MTVDKNVYDFDNNVYDIDKKKKEIKQKLNKKFKMHMKSSFCTLN